MPTKTLLNQVHPAKGFVYDGEKLIRDVGSVTHDDRLYFKTDDAARPAYLDHGMEPFKPNDKQTLKSYYEVPVGVLESHEELAA